MMRDKNGHELRVGDIAMLYLHDADIQVYVKEIFTQADYPLLGTDEVADVVMLKYATSRHPLTRQCVSDELVFQTDAYRDMPATYVYELLAPGAAMPHA